jgi:predicted MFS family arabinose efflux permease
LRGSGTALFRDRSFVALLIASIVPFSIAQVGFLYYAMPLFLHDRGEATSTIGTVLAVYSVVYVFAAPRLAQFVDTHAGKKGFVALGGLVGGGALLVLLALPNLYGVVIATVILAIASSIGGAAQTSYALQLAAVRVAGPGFATGLQRSADKFGQMLGPLIVGSLYAGHGLITALVLTGAFYIVATAFYWLAARE